MGTRHRRRLHRADAGRGRDAPAAPDLDGEARRRRGAGASGGVALLGTAAVAVAAQDDDETFLGAGIYSPPKFDGSSKRSLDPIPVVRYYGKPWFARTTQGILEGGGRWQIGRGVAAGAQLAYESGPLDHHPGASIGVHLEVDRMLGPAPLNALVRLRQFLENGRGVEFDARATVGGYEGHGFAAGL